MEILIILRVERQKVRQRGESEFFYNKKKGNSGNVIILSGSELCDFMNDEFE